MGQNKSMLLIQDQPVIKRISSELSSCCNELVVVTNEPSTYAFLNVPLIRDRYINKGPLAGLETAFHYVEADIFLVAACDMPFINCNVYNYLASNLMHYDAVVPVYDGAIHPLAGVYRKSVLGPIQNQLQRDERKVRKVFDHINVNYVSDYETISDKVLAQHFFNMNNPSQYMQAKRMSCSK